MTAHETARATPHTVLSLARFLRYLGSEFPAATGECAGSTIGAEDLVTGFSLASSST